MTKMTVMMPYDSAIPKKRNEPFRYRATDTGNAQRMYDQQGENIRCVIDEKDFALWESEKGIWVKSQDSKMLQTLASGVVETITPENTLLEVEGDELWQRKSESLGKIKAMIGQLWKFKQLKVRSSSFDRFLMKLNVRNYTINLGTVKPYDWIREDYLTKQAPVLYDDDARCPQFDEAVRQRQKLRDPNLQGHAFCLCFGARESGNVRGV